jgi:hypothetical protein
MEQNRRLFACLEENSSLARRMDARSCYARRSAEEDPPRFPTAIGSGHRTKGRVGSRNGASDGAKAIPLIPACCVRARGHTIRPTSAGTRASKPVSWRCVSLPRSTWDVRQARGPCSIICRVIRSRPTAGVRLPRSSRTIWKLLRKNGCIVPKLQRKRRPTEPRKPLEEIQMDAQRCEPCVRLHKVPRASASM